MLLSNAGNDEFTPSKTGKTRRYGLFMLPLVLGPLCLVLMAFVVLPTEWFSRHSGDVWLSGLGYGEHLTGGNCQILIYGDSSAEVGVDPTYIKDHTGLQTCNIAQPESFLVVNHDVILNDYLAHNAPPRIIVILLAPEGYSDLTVRMFPKVFEGITWRLGQPHKISGILQSMKVPENFFRWVYKGDHLVVRNFFSAATTQEAEHAREANQGQLPINDPMMTECSDSRKNPPPSRSYIAKLRSQYQRPDMPLLLDVMPLPQCDPGFTVIEKQLQGLVDSKVEQFPDRVFYAEGRHVDKSGSALLSQMIANQVQQKLNSEQSSREQ